MKTALLKSIFFVIVFATCIYAIVPFESNGPSEIKNLRPQPLPAKFGLTVELPGGTNLLEAPCHSRLDPVTGRIEMLTGYALPIPGFASVDEFNATDALLAFVSAYPDFFGVSELSLEPYSVEWARDRAFVSLRQTSGNVPVWGGYLTAIITSDARIAFTSNKLVPEIGLPAATSIDEERGLEIAIRRVSPKIEPRRIDRLGKFVYPEWNETGFTAHTVWVYRIMADDPIGLWQVVVDVQSGDIVAITNELRAFEHSGVVRGQYHPEFKDELLETGDWFYTRIYLGSTLTYADVGGSWTLDVASAAPDFSTTHYSRYANVTNDSGSDASFTASAISSPYSFTWTEATSPDDQMNGYYHTNRMHNYVKDTLGFSGMDYRMTVTVNYSYMADNANYDGHGINFGGGETIFYDMALFSDVIYHEYTHGVTHHIYPSGMLPYSGQSGAIDEALSDYFACSITGNPLMGDGGLFRDGTTFMRRVNGLKVFPGNFVGEVHADGEIISPCWWTILEEIGRPLADSLVHLTRFLYPEDFEAFFWATLTTDDDDGNIYNGTPHGRLIYESYGAHGIGPGFLLDIAHRPLNNTDDTTGTYRVEAMFNATLGVLEDSIALYWRLDGGAWEREPMTPIFGVYKGFIEAQTYGSVIDYYIIASDNGGNPMVSPAGVPLSWHTFSVLVDSSAPTIIALPIGPWFEYAWPPQWELDISDDQGISMAGIYGRIGSTDLSPSPLYETETWDVWVGDLPGMPFGGDTVDYWSVAIDNSSSHNVASYPPGGSYKVYVYPGYLEDFEIVGRGYSTYSILSGYVSEWSRVSQNNPWSTGSHCFYFGSGSEYSDQADGALTTPDLRIGTAATLTFWHTIDAENGSGYDAWDGGIVEVSTDGGENWMQIDPVPGYNKYIRDNPESPFASGTPCYSGSISWRQDSVDLSPFYPTARVRFHFGSDAHVTAGGWFIDDIQLITDLIDIPENPFKPQDIALSAYPNPFNSAVRISVEQTFLSVQNGQTGMSDLPTVEIFDIAGRLVADLPVTTCDFENPQVVPTPVIWQPEKSVGSGVFLVRAKIGDKSVTKKIIYLK